MCSAICRRRGWLSEAYGDDGEHHLSDVESVAPVVVGDVAVILLDAEQPAAEDAQFDVESAHQVQFHEHPQTSLRQRHGKLSNNQKSDAVEMEL